ncbi:MAG: valine--tRNA ligase [Magnetovibrio sp.]|nr:valine--tRNA ligase [Magnetovibrio sp.]
MLDKTYGPKAIEKKHYDAWEQGSLFSCDKASDANPYTIVIPPPNVTGSLHMGHALNNTLQDILIRYKRKKGFDALWQPGTDHAGIATQMVVERQMEAENLTRYDLGRDKFIERVWKWKSESGGSITSQLRRLGASCDWSRERFTMDEGLSAAVRRVFVKLYNQGLIYRDKRLVNWDPKLKTAISDLEVEQREIIGEMWYFKYPVEGDSSIYVTVGTTRPETMLGDTAVAVHPNDSRYKHLVGKNLVLPIVDRVIPIVADEYADPEKGTGAVKITPAHDFNDFEVGRRNNLKLINVLNQDAHMNDNVPEHLRGLDRYECRVLVIREMESLGLLDKIEENPMTIPYGDRSGVVIEPWLMDQWFVDAQRLAGPAITAVEQGKTVFIPNQWENTYYEWMRNIQPWCISRQIWWGHQIPAWFGPDGEIFVAETEEAAIAAAFETYGKHVVLGRDPDVLDTWFSSALWPFSTLGWPENTTELDRYYKTDVLVTGFDIIFFWVARMMMMGIHFMDGEVPFHTVYIHALVRDEKGQKMSKSKGNVIDPIELIEKYGADALRFTLTALAAQGRDVRLSEKRVEGYRNFCTKLWNASRFCELNGCLPSNDFNPSGVDNALNRWIIGKTVEAEQAVSGAIDAFRFNEAANTVYKFTWGIFCDWYLELAKPVLQGEQDSLKSETQATAGWVLDQILHLLHPIMPFITEELWKQIACNRACSLITADWPNLKNELIDPQANAELDWVIRLITQVRAIRNEMNIPAKVEIPLMLKDANDLARNCIVPYTLQIKRLARIKSIELLEGNVPKGSLQDVLDEATIILPVADVIDIGTEEKRLEREILKMQAEVERFNKKLSNEKFISNAPEFVVQLEREKLNEAKIACSRLGQAKERLLQAR